MTPWHNTGMFVNMDHNDLFEWIVQKATIPVLEPTFYSLENILSHDFGIPVDVSWAIEKIRSDIYKSSRVRTRIVGEKLVDLYHMIGGKKILDADFDEDNPIRDHKTIFSSSAISHYMQLHQPWNYLSARQIGSRLHRIKSERMDVFGSQSAPKSYRVNGFVEGAIPALGEPVARYKQKVSIPDGCKIIDNPHKPYQTKNAYKTECPIVRGEQFHCGGCKHYYRRGNDNGV